MSSKLQSMVVGNAVYLFIFDIVFISLEYLVMPGADVIIPTFLDWFVIGIVFLCCPCLHCSMMASWYVAHFAPLPSSLVCAQCCGENNLVSVSGEYSVLGRVISCILPSSSSIFHCTVPVRNCVLEVPLYPVILIFVGLGLSMKSAKQCVMDRLQQLSTIISKESVSKCILFSLFVVVWCANTVSMTFL